MLRVMRLPVIGGLTLGLALAASMPAVGADLCFEGLQEGEIMEEIWTGYGVCGDLSDAVEVFGYNPAFGMNVNAAIVFDSDCPPDGFPGDCSGGDDDLGTPNITCPGGGPGVGSGGECPGEFENKIPLHNTAIVAEDLRDSDNDGYVDDPDDADRKGQFIEFNFRQLRHRAATVNSITYMDAELEEGEDGAIVELWPGPQTITLTPTGDNGVTTQDIGIEGVQIMRVVLNGSGAITGAVIEEEIEGRPCWVTYGGFNNADVESPQGKKTCTFGGNIGPPPSGSFEVNWHETNGGQWDGWKFHTNDIEAIECIDMGSTGPQQPGGKKGLEVDTLFFTCTGKLNNLPGYTCEGFMKDSGEPHGKKGNDRDQIRFIVREEATGDIVASCGEPLADGGDLDWADDMDGSDLHGGNVQIHPCLGNQCLPK